MALHFHGETVSVSAKMNQAQLCMTLTMSNYSLSLVYILTNQNTSKLVNVVVMHHIKSGREFM